MQQLAANVGVARVCSWAETFICQLTEGNYRLFVDGILSYCGIGSPGEDVISKGDHILAWLCRVVGLIPMQLSKFSSAFASIPACCTCHDLLQTLWDTGSLAASCFYLDLFCQHCFLMLVLLNWH